jgi:carbon storage regulator
MLVLSRKTNETICIAGEIEVMVVEVRGKRVKLGFRAPANVSIQRKERVIPCPSELATACRARGAIQR